MFSNIVIPPPAPQKSKAYPITDPQVLVLCVIAPEKPRKISFSGRGFEACPLPVRYASRSDGHGVPPLPKFYARRFV
jgi:hypothetical protein